MQQHFQRVAIECKLKTTLSHIRIGIFGSLLPPLGLFSQNKFFFLSLCQKHLFWQIKRSFKSKFDQMPKTPPFPIIKFLPHKRTIFAITWFWSNTKNVTLKFWNSQVVGWSSCFGLNFSPFGLSTKIGELFGPLIPLPHTNVK